MYNTQLNTLQNKSKEVNIFILIFNPESISFILFMYIYKKKPVVVFIYDFLL